MKPTKSERGVTFSLSVKANTDKIDCVIEGYHSELVNVIASAILSSPEISNIMTDAFLTVAKEKQKREIASTLPQN